MGEGEGREREVEGRLRQGRGGDAGVRKSSLELFEAYLTHSYWLFGVRRQGVLGRTLGAEDVSTMSAVVLNSTEEERSRSDQPSVHKYRLRRVEGVRRVRG